MTSSISGICDVSSIVGIELNSFMRFKFDDVAAPLPSNGADTLSSLLLKSDDASLLAIDIFDRYMEFKVEQDVDIRLSVLPVSSSFSFATVHVRSWGGFHPNSVKYSSALYTPDILKSFCDFTLLLFSISLRSLFVSLSTSYMAMTSLMQFIASVLLAGFGGSSSNALSALVISFMASLSYLKTQSSSRGSVPSVMRDKAENEPMTSDICGF